MNRFIPLLALAVTATLASGQNQGSMQGTPGGGFTYGNARSYTPAPVFAPLPLMTVDPAAPASSGPAGPTVLTSMPGMGPSTLAPIDPMRILSGVYLQSAAPDDQAAAGTPPTQAVESDYPPGTIRIVAPDDAAAQAAQPVAQAEQPAMQVEQPSDIVHPDVAQTTSHPSEDLRPPIAYDPGYVSMPEVMPQTIYVESPPQVIVQQEYVPYYPYPVWDPFFCSYPYYPYYFGFGVSICFSDHNHDHGSHGWNDGNHAGHGTDSHAAAPGRPTTIAPIRTASVTPIAPPKGAASTPTARAPWVENSGKTSVPVISAAPPPIPTPTPAVSGAASAKAPVKSPASATISTTPRPALRVSEIPTLKSSKPVDSPAAAAAPIVRPKESDRPPIAPVIAATPPSPPVRQAAPVALRPTPTARVDRPAPTVIAAPAPRIAAAAPRSAPEPARISITPAPAPAPAPTIRAAPAPAMQSAGPNAGGGRPFR